MAEVKISALGSATSPLNGDEAVPVVQGGVTKRTTAAAIANLLAPAVNVVSQALSVEQAARNADVNRLSNQISDIISAGGGAISVTSSELSAVSAQANFHANVISLNLEVEIADRKSAISSPSARTSAGASVHGLQSVFDALSDRISGVAAGAVSVTSDELSIAAAALSNRISITSALASVAELHGATASAAATSANLHANAASAAATSVLCIMQNASVKSVGGTSARGIQSALDALSNRISANSAGGASVTSNELSAAVGVSVVSAGTSVKGLQSVVDTLSNRISAIVAGAQSVTSNELSNAVSVISQKISTVSAALLQETNDRTSADNVLSFRVSVLSNALSIETADRISAINAMSNLLSAAAINTASAFSVTTGNIVLLAGLLSNLTSAHNVLSNRVSANSAVAGTGSVTSNEMSQILSQRLSAVNNISAKSGATSVKGIQSVIDQLSNRISAGGGGGGSVTSNEASAISAQALSAINVVSNNLSALSTAHTLLSNALSARILSIAANSNAISVVSVHADVASAAATSADIHAAAASAAATSVDARVNTVSNLVSVLTSAHNALSNIVSNALSAGDVASNAISVISARVQVLSAGIGSVQLNRLQTTATISASGLTKISGLSCQLVSGGAYQIKAVLMHSHSAQTTNGFGFGVSATAPTLATGIWRGHVSVPSEALFFGYFNQAGLGSITYSATPSASATNYRTDLEMDIVGAVSSRLQIKARSSAAGVGAIDVKAGSYIQAFRIG